MVFFPGICGKNGFFLVFYKIWFLPFFLTPNIVRLLKKIFLYRRSQLNFNTVFRNMGFT